MASAVVAAIEAVRALEVDPAPVVNSIVPQLTHCVKKVTGNRCRTR